MKSLFSLRLNPKHWRILPRDNPSTARIPRFDPPIPVIVGVDVEPDLREVDLTDPAWQGTELFFSRVAELRARIARESGGNQLKLTWFPRSDPQVEMANGNAGWALDRFMPDWDEVRRAGDEIGLHMHPWRWQDGRGWVQDLADDAWVTSCLRSSIEAYRQAFGAPPAAYRGGDRYLSNSVVRLLEREGVKLDLTLERMPGVDRLVEAERGTGAIPDTSRISMRAFRPSSDDFRIADPHRNAGLVMLPLTAHRDGTLNPWLPNGLFEDTLKQLLDKKNEQSERPTHLAFVARSDLSLLPQWKNFVLNLRSLARRVARGRLIFTTASEALDRMEATPG